MKFAPKTTIIAVSVAPMSKSMDERNLKVAETVASRIAQFRTITVTARLNRLTNESAHYYFAPGRAAKYCNGRVCVSVCVFFREHISGTTRPIFTKYFAFVLWPCISFPLGRCDMLCVSGFMDDIIFAT